MKAIRAHCTKCENKLFESWYKDEYIYIVCSSCQEIASIKKASQSLKERALKILVNTTVNQVN